jgi:PhnB protein
MTRATAPDGSAHHSLIPVLVVADADAAVDFYVKAFGAQEIIRIRGTDSRTAHGQVRIGDTILFVALQPDNRDTYLSPGVLGGTTTAVYSYWEDCDAAFGKAVESGAKAIDQPVDLSWGDRVGLVRDPFGHLWSIASRIPNRLI